MNKEFENLLSILESPNSENIPLALKILPNYEKELKQQFFCGIAKLKSCLLLKQKIGNISLEACLTMTTHEKMIRKALF